MHEQPVLACLIVGQTKKSNQSPTQITIGVGHLYLGQWALTI